MKKIMFSLILMLLLSIFSQPALAKVEDVNNSPWEKFSLDLGVFVSDISSEIQFGSGVGVDINVEDLLGMDTNTAVFRFDGAWRFTQNRRHRLDFSWYVFRRDGNKQIDQEIKIENPIDGSEITIPAGARVESFLNLDVYKVAYSYSFFQDDRFDLALSFGLYIMPIEFGFSATGVVTEKADESIIAPLPVFGFRGDFAITPKWFIRTGTEIFYLEIDQFKGSIYSAGGAVEYKPWKNVGLGLGADIFRINIEGNGEDWPGIDLKGEVEFTYFGLQLYTKVFF